MSFHELSLNPPNLPTDLKTDQTETYTTSIESALDSGITRTDKPLSNIKKMLEEETFFKDEFNSSIDHQDQISIDLSKDFNDLKQFAKKKSTYQAIANFLENRIAFAKSVFSDVKDDLNRICAHFDIEKSEISSISLQTLGADSHNKGKSTIFIIFKLKDGGTKTIVYKPRLMLLEQAVCDKETGIFSRLKKLEEIDEIIDIDSLTYPVMAMENNQRYYGYSLKVDGLVLYDENSNASISTDNFMLPDHIIMTDTFLKTIEDIRKTISSLETGELIQETIEMIKTTYHVDCDKNSLVIFLEETLSKSYFSTRDDKQLIGDYLLFHVLALMTLGDLHAGNFILSSKSSLVPIDLECLQDGDALSILALIKCEIERRNLSIPEKVIDSIGPYLGKTPLDIQNRPLRVVPIGTKELYQLREKFLIGLSSNPIENITNQINFFVELENLSQFEKLIKDCFICFDIPFFQAQDDYLFVDGVRVGRILPLEESMQRLQQRSIGGNSSAQSGGSFIDNDLASE